MFDSRYVPYLSSAFTALAAVYLETVEAVDRVCWSRCSCDPAEFGENVKITIAMVALLAVWPFNSAKEYHMTSGVSVPAATGTVKVQRDKDNGNIKLDIKVDHLARPSSLTPSAGSYLVWIRPNGGEALKQGAIGVDKNLSGELKVETVSKDFDLFITAEQANSATLPSNVEVVRTHVSMN